MYNKLIEVLKGLIKMNSICEFNWISSLMDSLLMDFHGELFLLLDPCEDRNNCRVGYELVFNGLFPTVLRFLEKVSSEEIEHCILLGTFLM